MKTWLSGLLLAFSLPLIATPEVGDPAPGFALAASDGNTYTLSELIGKQGAVIAFFPKAFTGG